MKNRVFCVGLATILAGCATADQQARQPAEGAAGKCRCYGARPGSPA
jgi:uncharacterized membrane protein